jgi:hypothetical protein
LGPVVAYTNNQGIDRVETAHVACGHLFDHQSYLSRAGHAMLGQASWPPPLEPMGIPDAELGEKRSSLNENLH